MFRTLRRRLVFSHVLPLLIVIPFIAVALIYILESRVLLSSLSNELIAQSEMVSNIANDTPSIWQGNSDSAQTFATRISSGLTARVMLLDVSGHMLASSDPRDSSQLGKVIPLPELPQVVQSKKNSAQTAYSQQLNADLADVLAPVKDPTGRVIGVIRLTSRLSDVYTRFSDLRFLVISTLFGALLLSAAIGWLLALTLQRPLRKVTLAVRKLADDEQTLPLLESGPDEIVLLVRAFNTLAYRLKASEQSRHQLLANMVHELGRPLGALQSATQALYRGADEDPGLREDLLTGMVDYIRRLKRLLDDLTQYYGRSESTIRLNCHPTALSLWLPPVLAPWRAAALAKPLSWDADTGDNLPTLNVDADRLAQAIGNLVSNAIKYTAVNGKIRIAAGVSGQDFWLQVSDTGAGIPPEDQAKVFEPFFRGGTTGRFPQGMGLGLTIARDLVVAHGGRLDLHSVAGQGSEFMIHLPLSERE